MDNKLSTQPPKGTADWLPEELALRHYIFNTWRAVCLKFGYQEYLTPLVEAAEIYRAKSGEDVGGKELMTFTDQGGRELSIRPEMTPSVTRLACRVYDAAPKPIRWFSIANFMRNEKPQRGRNREFWQLNVDMFGSMSLNSDLEALLMSLEIMHAFKAPANSFKLCLNHRKLIDGVLTLAEVKPEQQVQVVRVMDKFLKLTPEDFTVALNDLQLSEAGQTVIAEFMKSPTLDSLSAQVPALAENEGYVELRALFKALDNLGYADLLQFKPSVIRGFDYYDGMVFEIFDQHPKNMRALFGGGRYNGLAGIFGREAFPAVGFAPGDETTKLFLESWNLLDNIRTELKTDNYYLPILSDNLFIKTQELAAKLRAEGKAVECGLETVRLGKALEYANKKQIANLVILGVDESKLGLYKIKNMDSGQEQEFEIS